MLKQTIIVLSRVCVSDQTFRISSRSNPEALVYSIGEAGLLHPPIVQEKGQGAFRIVSGFLRVAACQVLGMDRIPAMVAPQDADPDRLAFVAVTENASQRTLDLMEQARAVRLLLRDRPWDERLPLIQKALGTPVSQTHCENLLRLCGLAPAIQEGVSSGAIGLAVALLLVAMPRGASEALGRIFVEWCMGLNKQREAVTLATEIARREDRTVKEVLSLPPIAQILQDPDPDGNRKTEALRKALFALRYPHVSAERAAFESRLADLALPRGLKLAPPKDFEGDTFEISLRFKSVEDLKKKSAVLSWLAAHPGLARILKPGS